MIEREKSPFWKYHNIKYGRQGSSMDAKINEWEYKNQNVCMSQRVPPIEYFSISNEKNGNLIDL